MSSERAVLGVTIRRLAVASVALLVLAACSSEGSSSKSTDSNKPFSPTLVRQLDEATNQALAEASIPGAIIGVWSPEGSYVRAIGVADKATGAPMKTDFFSRLGSETKTFTVTAVLQLEDEGKLSMDDHISKFIPGIVNGDQVTLRQMAMMRSGIPSYTFSDAFQKDLFSDPQRVFTPAELIKYIEGEPAVFPPGDSFQYSNSNTVLLGMVVEKLSGQPLQEFFKEKIFTPLHMSDTIFATTNAFPSPHAQGYTNQTLNGSVAITTDWNPSWGWAAGAMISTLNDLRIWAPALAEGKLLKPATQAERLKTLPVKGYAPGTQYGTGLFNAGGWIGHNGSLPGYQSVTMYLPETKTTMVLLTNTDISYKGGEPSTMLANAITKVISPAHVYVLQEDGAPAPG